MTEDHVDDPIADLLEHRALSNGNLVSAELNLAELDLAEHAASAAKRLKADHPTVVFTSGRRSVSDQADAMAGNVVVNRKWIVQTYAASNERDTLQKWVDENPTVTRRQSIAAGLSNIMTGWTDAQRVKLSRHFAGLAFDVRPGDAAIKDAIKVLPNLVKFLDSEGGITIWHAEFKAA